MGESEKDGTGEASLRRGAPTLEEGEIMTYDDVRSSLDDEGRKGS